MFYSPVICFQLVRQRVENATVVQQCPLSKMSESVGQLVQCCMQPGLRVEDMAWPSSQRQIQMAKA